MCTGNLCGMLASMFDSDIGSQKLFMHLASCMVVHIVMCCSAWFLLVDFNAKNTILNENGFPVICSYSQPNWSTGTYVNDILFVKH